MADVLRGDIRHKARARQLINFSGMTWGRITPTDLDGMIEYKNRCYLFMELKHYSNPEIPFGQDLALTRLTSDIVKPAILIHALHYVDDPKRDIDAHECVVHKYFWHNRWRIPPRIINPKEAADVFLRLYGEG